MLNKMYKCTSMPIMTLLRTHMATFRHGLFLGLFSGRNYLLFLLLCFTGSALAQMTVEDTDSNILMEVSDEGTVGSIVLPDTSAAPLITINKLYNLGGTLNWNGSPLALGGSSNWTVSGNNMYSNVSGNVGIGTPSPLFNLHISDIGSIIAQNPTKLGISNLFGGLDPAIIYSNWFNISVGTASSSIIRKSGTDLFFNVHDNMLAPTDTVQMLLTSNGLLGVGTMNPYQKLDVVSSDDTKDAAARFMNDNGTLLDIGVSGSNSGSGAGNDNPYIYTNSKDLVILTGAGIVRVNGILSDGADVVAGNGGGILISGGGKISLMNENGDGPIISLDPTQNNRKITTPILEITGGSDLAEPFDITNNKTIKPGMVVAIDSQNPGQLRIADKAYDRTVAGIVSGANGINPGMIMSQKETIADNSLLVALTGRVYVWADASNGSIEPGDLLTTSDTPGHAMKVTNYERAQGAIMGKAMTSLLNGRGLVLVLVSLQ